MSKTPYALAVHELSKTFGRQRALDHLSLTIRQGAVTALLGQNGSGKSTLIKILAGVYFPDPGGRVDISGQAVELPLSSRDARQRGLYFVHQDLGLVKDLTVAENIGIANGFASHWYGPIHWRRLRRSASESVSGFGVEIPGERLVRDLGAAEQTLLAIARAFTGEAERRARPLLVLDEPTAALPREQVAILFEAVRRVRDRGASILYVTHRLDEVYELADDVAVLRDGSLVLSGQVGDVNRAHLVEAIVGEELPELARAVPPEPEPTAVLAAKDLYGKRVDGVSLTIRRGEIVGVAGLHGSGRSELARLLSGAQAPRNGMVQNGVGNQVRGGPRGALKDGILLVPEDRRRLGAVMEMSVRANIGLPNSMRHWRSGILRHRQERSDVRDWMRQLHVVPREPELLVGKLSGGNQQKTILAKWLRLRPRTLILDEPTQGVDVGAKAEILAFLRETASQGVGMLVISSEFVELAAICHRVLILRDGRVASQLSGDGLTAAQITRACYDDSSDIRRSSEVAIT